jgi:hypothetical protein
MKHLCPCHGKIVKKVPITGKQFPAYQTKVWLCSVTGDPVDPFDCRLVKE